MPAAVSEGGDIQSEPKSTKFPVFSLMIRELDAETCSHQTAPSAKQSAIFAFSAGNSKIIRMFGIFFDLRAPEKLGFGRQQPNYARFSLSRAEPVPFRRSARPFRTRK